MAGVVDGKGNRMNVWGWELRRRELLLLGEANVILEMINIIREGLGV